MKSIADRRAEQETVTQTAGEPQEAQGPRTASGDGGANGFTSGIEEATPEEQQAYEGVVSAGSEIIWSDESRAGVKQMLESSKDNPPQAIANLVVMIIKQLDEGSGGQLPESMIFNPIEELVAQAADFANESGVMQVDDQTANQAAQLALEQLAVDYDYDLGALQAEMDAMDPVQRQELAQQGADAVGAGPLQMAEAQA